MTDEECVCAVCGQSFNLTEREEAWLRERLERRGAPYEPPSRCRECQARAFIRAHAGYVLSYCRDCGEPFPLPPGLDEPARCRGCWQARRERRVG